MPITTAHLFGALRALLPEASFGCDSDCQLIVYTNLTTDFSRQIHAHLEERDWTGLENSKEYVAYKDQAVLVQREHVIFGGLFSMNRIAKVGYYYIKSDDPAKEDLVLPPHIFRKCFQWVNISDHERYPDIFSFVREI